MSDEEQKRPEPDATDAGPAEPAAGRPAAEAGPADVGPADAGPSTAEPADAGPATAEPADEGASGVLRMVGAMVTLPWVLLYGVTGVWAIALAARAYSQGLKQLDAGYTRYVTPPQLGFVGALLLVAFAVVLACGLLILFQRRSAVAWLPLLLVAAGLTAGALWAGIEGELHPLLWVFLFFGLVYATVVGAARVLHVTRDEHRGTIAPP
jgi:hypothetical protein